MWQLRETEDKWFKEIPAFESSLLDLMAPLKFNVSSTTKVHGGILIEGNGVAHLICQL